MGKDALVLAVLCSLVAAIGLRVLGAFHGVEFIYGSIAASALTVTLLVVAVRRSRRS